MAAGPPAELPCATDFQETMPFDVSVAAAPESSTEKTRSVEKTAEEKRNSYQNGLEGKTRKKEKVEAAEEDSFELYGQFSDSEKEARFYKHVPVGIVCK